MNTNFLLVRLRRSLTGLERTLGLLRVQLLDLPRISLTSDYDGSITVLVSLAELSISGERLASELAALQDVTEVRWVRGDAAVVRETALAWVANHVSATHEDARVLVQGGDSALLEITGTPQEIDRAVEALRDVGALLALTRTGAITVCPADAAASWRP